MTVTCASCSYENPVGTEFCEACGSEISLPSVAAPSAPTEVQMTTSPIQSYSDHLIEIQPPIPQPTYPNPTPTPINLPNPTISVGAAKLISKQTGSSGSEFPLSTLR